MGCSGPGELITNKLESSENKGTVFLSINDNTRTLAPTLSMEVGEYKAVFTKAGLQNPQTIANSGNASIALEEGAWTVQVDAYNNEVPAIKIGSGSSSFNIQAGESTSVSLSVVPIVGQGVLNIGTVWTGLNLATPSITASLTPKGATNPVNLTFTLSGESASATLGSLANGYYTLALNLYDGTTLVKGVVEVVRIIAGATTEGNFAFSTSGSTGNVDVTISVNLQIPMVITISGVSSGVKLGNVITATAAADTSGVTWSWYLNGVKQDSITSTITLTTGTGGLGVGTYRLDAIAAKGDILSSNFQIFTVSADILDPTVSATPGTGEFTTEEVEVTLGAENPASGEYKIDSGSWVQYTSGMKINLGKTLSDSQSVVLALRNGAANGTYTYTKKIVVVTGTPIGYKATAAPTIWLWENPGRAIMALEGKVWPGPNMVPADVDGYFVYTIPESYKPLAALAFKFNSGAQLDLSAADVAAGKTWYNGTAWITKPAPVPGVPKIVISPAGGYFDPTQIVTVTITDDPIAGATTAASYTLNTGTPVTITGGTATFTLSATTALAVTATNSAGTANATAAFTKGVEVAKSFSWDNASVYFVITDRFNNGNPDNDGSYGRVKVDATGKNIGTFHGGDIAGLKAKVDSDYFSDLGVNAIWMTAPYEQMHGFVGGGSTGDFAHYAYHGYYTLDYSNIDSSMGTKAEFKAFVDAAHAKGIRVVLDIVMNHSGYLSLKDMDDFNMGGKKAGFTSAWTPSGGQTWNSYHDLFIDYTASGATGWGNWWGGSWVRAGLPGYPGDAVSSGADEVKGNLANLPDFRTESDTPVGLPTFLKNKATYAGAFSNYTVNTTKSQKVREWIAEWLAQWVREYGIDGFRIDTAKHVERTSWAFLKTQSDAALKAWRLANPTAPGATWTEDFWTTAEVFDHGMASYDGDYHGNGMFDSIINFGFAGVAGSDFGTMVSTYQSYASSINATKTDKWNYLSFIDNHDKGNVFYNGDAARQIKAGTALLLAPGGIQIYYGDEYGRANGENGSDKDQGSRSAFVWTDLSGRGAATAAHWQKLGQFRNKHVAVGGGDHANIAATNGSAFSRIWGTDKVAAVIGASGTVDVTVSSLFADGTLVKNAYDGTTATVAGGKVSFSAGTNGVILIEKN